MRKDSVLVCSVTNIIQFKVNVENVVLAEILESIGNPSFLSILGSRLLINLKEAGELGLNEGTNYRPGSKSVSDIAFVEGHVEGWQLYLIFMRKFTSYHNVLIC